MAAFFYCVALTWGKGASRALVCPPGTPPSAQEFPEQFDQYSGADPFPPVSMARGVWLCLKTAFWNRPDAFVPGVA